eukprot:COSAG01_NODE_17645_length_1134_cov_1.657005_1_plen_202_part_00
MNSVGTGAFSDSGSSFYEDQQPGRPTEPPAAEFAAFGALAGAVGSLFNSPVLSDVVIEVADEAAVPSEEALRIPAHRVVLAGWSEVWQRLVTQDIAYPAAGSTVREAVVRINGYPAETMLQLCEFCYRGKTRVTLSGAIALLAAARQFQMDDLRRFCEDYCLHSMQATGVCSLHEEAKRYNCRRLCAGPSTGIFSLSCPPL